METDVTELGSDHLLLKWGTLKGWTLHNKKSLELVRKWIDLGVSASCMAQHDTSEQKAIICDLIREHTGTIQNDWDGEEYSKERAIDYIMNYGA